MQTQDYIEDRKRRFREYQTDRFLRLLNQDFHNWYPKAWKPTSNEYMRRLLRGKPLEVYLDKIFTLLSELIEKGHLPLLAATAFGYWCMKVEADILDEIKYKEYADLKATSIKGVFERHRKTIKPQLQRYVDAYRVFKDLSDQFHYSIGYETGMAGYLENNDYTHVQPGFNDLGMMLREILATNPLLSAEVLINDDLGDSYKGVYEDFLEVRLTTTVSSVQKRKFFFQFRNDDVTLSHILHQLSWSILEYAESKFGHEGKLIADIMMGNRELKDADNQWFRPRKRKKGRPREEHIDRMILYLNEHDVDDLWIARFINALENRERYKEATDEATWSIRQQRMKPLGGAKIRKAIRERIKKLGGNALRFEIDRLIKERGECLECDWRFDEDGVLIRLPCKSHKHAPKEIGVSKAGPNWMESLQKKGLHFYANALTFADKRETKSKKTELRKDI